MGKTYKTKESFGDSKGNKTKRIKAKGSLKRLPKKYVEEDAPYNDVDSDYAEDGNFEKFKRKR